MFCHTRLLGCRKNFRELLGNGLIIRGSGVGIPHLHTKPLVYYLHILYKIVEYITKYLVKSCAVSCIYCSRYILLGNIYIPSCQVAGSNPYLR